MINRVGIDYFFGFLAVKKRETGNMFGYTDILEDKNVEDACPH